MTTRELRQKYIAFFESKEHLHFPSGSLIPYDVSGKLDESLLFNGAGMVQFKPFFRGVAEPPQRRLITAQKCVRTGDIESVGDDSHLTFFEMLGNFSFGDYFKEEAIKFSWEFLTEKMWLGLDPKRLAFTVFDEDDVAYNAWKDVLTQSEIDPNARIFRLGEDTNYWPAGAFSAGPPGPCGPNSEMFYWTSNEIPPPSGSYRREDFVRDEAEGKWLEIWNDVFIQYEWQGVLKNPDRPSDGYQKSAMPELPFRSIDTGMGLERTTAVLGGFHSVYDTDTFQTIIKTIEGISDLKYGVNPDHDRAFRIVADHIRTASFCIADGILPSNNGRGYVLRRLIRRAILKCLRVLQFGDSFLHQVFDGVEAAMADYYTELTEKRATIKETLKSEEMLFRRTIRQGGDLLNGYLDRVRAEGSKLLKGDDAFMLYDTFGFPLEVTQELCDEAGIEVDVAGFEAAMREAQNRSRHASGMDTVYGGTESNPVDLLRQKLPGSTDFVGYEIGTIQTRIIAAIPEINDQNRTTGRFALALEQTPFYAESGGQVSDLGVVHGAGFELEVEESIKQDGIYVHLVNPLRTSNPESFENQSFEDLQEILSVQFIGQPVVASIDFERRSRVIRNHTATHLLHAGLRNVLGTHVSQAGSLVAADQLRFDFTHSKAMTKEELDAVEQWVNEQILSSYPVTVYAEVPISQAKSMGAMALFGEKYGDHVRVVEIRDFTGAPVSIELCGGCHTHSTGQIGFLKITHEASVASGIRRIQAVTGQGALAWVNEQTELIHEAAAALKSNPHELVGSIKRVLENLREERKKREKLALQSSKNEAEITPIGEFTLATLTLHGMDAKETQAIVERTWNSDPKRIALVVVTGDDKVTFTAKAGKGATDAGFNCGNFVKMLAQFTGGGGGGRPEFATAGGRDASKVEEALGAAPIWVKENLKA